MNTELPPADCPRCRLLEQRVAELERLLQQRVAELERRVAQQQRTIQRLNDALEEARRAGKRQAAPFRKKGGPKRKPRKPGRKSGDEHGRHARGAVPEQFDETHEAPLPAECPHCGGQVQAGEGAEVVEQYQQDIEVRVVRRRFRIHVDHCGQCGGRVQGRHPLQTSDALGAAAAQLGPTVHALLAILNKDLGLSHGKSVKLIETLSGLKISRGASTRSMLRTARRAEPEYAAIGKAVRESNQVVPDETGWRVGGKNAWLHVAVGNDATWYEIAPTRGGDVLAGLLGDDWSGHMAHDGCQIYNRFEDATHQQCNNHVLVRADHLLETATGGAVHFPRQVKELFQEALAWRDRYRERASPEERLAAWERYSERLKKLVARPKTNADNERLRRHLDGHLYQWFWFLTDPHLDATNWRAEQALRPAVVNRKVWGGNRTWPGARAQSVLTSLLTTCRQRGQDALAYFKQLLCRPTRPQLRVA